jgi:hypothetical protein
MNDNRQHDEQTTGEKVYIPISINLEHSEPNHAEETRSRVQFAALYIGSLFLALNEVRKSFEGGEVPRHLFIETVQSFSELGKGLADSIFHHVQDFPTIPQELFDAEKALDKETELEIWRKSGGGYRKALAAHLSAVLENPSIPAELLDGIYKGLDALPQAEKVPFPKRQPRYSPDYLSEIFASHDKEMERQEAEDNE